MAIPSSSTQMIIILIITIICCSASFSGAVFPDTYAGHTCSSSTFDTNTNYTQNLKLLLADLAKTAPSSAIYGGYAATRWADDPNNILFGLAQCRGDMLEEDCKPCIDEAITSVTNTYCPNSRSATIWRDYCQVKYSDVDFFGKIDFDNSLTITDKKDLDSPRQEAAGMLMTRLSQQVGSTDDKGPDASRLFANGSFAGVYGAAQCTQDISLYNCKACLGRAVSELSKCCGAYAGARVAFGSCYVRREIFSFLKEDIFINQ